MVKLIPLSRGLVALVDDVDFDAVRRLKWYAGLSHGSFYAVRKPDGGVLYLHRHLTGAPAGTDVDHINGDTLDNRRCNLRLATHQQNLRNSKTRIDNRAGYKGVWTIPLRSSRSRQFWAAYIGGQGERTYLGRFSSPEAAARAYDTAARDLYGEFARVNFPEAAVPL